MTQKEQFKAEVEKVKLIIQSNRAQGAFAEGYLIGQESVLEYFENFVNSMQEEPVSRTSTDIETAMQEVDEKSKAFTEAHQGEDADTILAQMRGEEPVSEDLEEEIRKYQKEVYDRDTTVRDVARHFANWQKQQMMKDAVDGEIVSVNTRLGQMFIAKSEILNDDKFKWDDKVKLIIAKED